MKVSEDGLGKKNIISVLAVVLFGAVFAGGLASSQITLHNGANMELGGGDIVDDGTTVWDSSNGYVPKAAMQSLTASDVGLGNVENENALAQDGSEEFQGQLNITDSLDMQGTFINDVLGIYGMSQTHTATLEIHTSSSSAQAPGLGNASLSASDLTCCVQSSSSDEDVDLDIESEGDIAFEADEDSSSGGRYFAYLSASDGSWNVDGTKNWIHSLNSTHEAVYTSQESPEVRAVYEGQTLVKGSKNVSLPSHFSKTVSDSKPMLRVQATPHELATVAVTERTDDYLVIESSKDVEVDFRVTGIREGYEDKQVVRPKE